MICAQISCVMMWLDYVDGEARSLGLIEGRQIHDLEIDIYTQTHHPISNDTQSAIGSRTLNPWINSSGQWANSISSVYVWPGIHLCGVDRSRGVHVCDNVSVHDKILRVTRAARANHR